MTDRHDAAAGVQHVPLAPTEEKDWTHAYGNWRRARLDRVQASARVWLGVLTTLLGLLGSVVLFKGGDLVTGVTSNGWLQGVLIALVGLVFLSAVFAVIAGGVATWGGLADIAASETATPPNPPLNGWRKQITKFVLILGLTPEKQRENALKVFDVPDKGDELAWQKYRDKVEDNADRNRIYLHASRVLGVIAAFFIAVLAIVAVTAGTVAPVPSDVVVVYHGKFACVPVSDSAQYTDVTQVVSVSGC